MSTLNEQIQERARAFAADISAIVRDSVIEALRQTGASRSQLTKREPRPVPATRRARPHGLTKGEKRAPVLIEQVTKSLHAHIVSYPGARIEDIAHQLGHPTRDLRLPIKRLLAANLIRTEGEKRATRYSPSRALSASPSEAQVGG